MSSVAILQGGDLHITLYGNNAANLREDIKDRIYVKVLAIGRRAPIRAKVALVQNNENFTGDRWLMARINEIVYFVGIFDGLVMLMDLHYVKNIIISYLLEYEVIINVC